MNKKRFIDLAVHGGCSKKLGAGELHELLSGLASLESSETPSTFTTWLDFGRFDLGGNTLVSNVDIVLPMVLSASDFGEIAVAHVLSDIYASGAKPLFALNILGIADGVASNDEDIISMLSSAFQKLKSRNVSLVGGHTLREQGDLYFGLAAIGIIDSENLITNDGAKEGEVVVLTKPLGTSVASINWKHHLENENMFSDVIVSMKQFNDVASEEMLKFGATACTDITGFGFLGHFHNLLRASGVSAIVHSEKLPVFESILPYVGREGTTSIWSDNFDYVKDFVNFTAQFTPLLENILFDSQVSGGLLITVSPQVVDGFLESLGAKGVDASIVGEIIAGDSGFIDVL